MNERIDYRALFGALRRQARLVLAVVFLTIVLALLYAYSRAPVYTATTLLQIEPQGQNLLSAKEGAQNFGINDIRVAGEIEILRSEAVAQRVVQAAALLDDAEFGAKGLAGAAALKKTIGNFLQALTVVRRGQTYLVSVQVSAGRPAQAAALSTLTAQSYIDSQIEARVAGLRRVAGILRGRLSGAQAGLLDAESAMDGFIGDNIAQIAARPGGGAITGLTTRVKNLQAQSARAESEIRRLNTALAAQDWGAVAQTLDIKTELAAIDAELAAQARLNGLRGTVAGLQAEASAAQGQLRSAVLSGEMPPDLLTRLYGLQQESVIARAQYDDFLSRLRAVEVQAGLQVAGARIVSPALVPITPSGQSRREFLALAAVLALLLGSGLAYMREYFIGGFNSAGQLADGVRLPVLAELPAVKPVSGAGDPSAAELMRVQPMGAYGEAIRRLRLGLTQAMPDGGQVVMVTSPLPGEGKTDTCLALGRAYAAAGQRCLLIDCDLRKPRIGRITGLGTQHGLHDMLSTGAALKGWVQQDPGSALYILPGAGPAGVPTDDLLGGPRFAALLAEARSAYDIVLLDTPPLHPVVDGLYLAPQADAVLLLVASARTPQRDLRAVLPALMAAKSANTPVLLALGQVQQKALGYGKKYAQYYQ